MENDTDQKTSVDTQKPKKEEHVDKVQEWCEELSRKQINLFERFVDELDKGANRLEAYADSMEVACFDISLYLSRLFIKLYGNLGVDESNRTYGDAHDHLINTYKHTLDEIKKNKQIDGPTKVSKMNTRSKRYLTQLETLAEKYDNSDRPTANKIRLANRQVFNMASSTVREIDPDSVVPTHETQKIATMIMSGKLNSKQLSSVVDNKYSLPQEQP